MAASWTAEEHLQRRWRAASGFHRMTKYLTSKTESGAFWTWVETSVSDDLVSCEDFRDIA